MWAVISCPFSSSTRNIALLKASTIVPSCSIAACLAILSAQFLFNYFKRRKDIRLPMMQRDGVFIVSGRFMIQRDSPPTIRQKPYGISALRNHWFDCYAHAVLQQHTMRSEAVTAPARTGRPRNQRTYFPTNSRTTPKPFAWQCRWTASPMSPIR